MMTDTMQQALNDQINAEFHSAYLYLAMAAWFRGENLNGFANWMEMQYQEEVAHAMKLYHFVFDRGGTVTLTAIDGPDTTWPSPLAAFEAALEHERYISSRINKLVKLAFEENDFAAHSFLQWYVNEQVEEEASVDEIVQTLKMLGEDKRGLFMLDRELAGRTAPQDEA